MKELFNYCSQVRRYGPSEGKCLVELEDEETLEDVLNKYVKVKREWHQVRYSNAKEIEEYTRDRFNGPVTYKGRLVIMNTNQEYLD